MLKYSQIIEGIIAVVGYFLFKKYFPSDDPFIFALAWGTIWIFRKWGKNVLT